MLTIAQIQTPSTLMQATASPCQEEVTPPARVLDRQARMARIIARQTSLDRVEAERGDKYTLELRATQERLARLRIADQNAFNVLERRVDSMQAQMPLRALQKQLDAIREEERTWITRLEADVNTLLQRNFKPLAQRIEAYTQQTTKQIQEVQAIVEKERQSIAQLTKMVDAMQVNIDELQRRHQELQTSQGDVSVQISHLQREAIALQQAILQAEIAIEERKENRWMQVVKIAAIIGACSLGSWALASAFKAGAIGAVTGVSAGEGVGFSLTLSGGELTANITLSGAATGLAVLATSGADSSSKKPLIQQTPKQDKNPLAKKEETRFDLALRNMEINKHRDSMRDAHLASTVLALPAQTIVWGAKTICKSHPRVEKVCGQLQVYMGQKAQQISEEPWIKEISQKHQQSMVLAAVADQRRFGIAPSESVQYYQNCQDIALSALMMPLAKAGSSVAKTFFAAGKQSVQNQTVKFLANRQLSKMINEGLALPLGYLEDRALQPVARVIKSPHLPERISYARNYYEDIKEFHRPPLQYKGRLESDLVLVQIHGSGILGVDRSLKWAMHIEQAQVNRINPATGLGYYHGLIDALDIIKDQVALLSSWGERSHITVIKIPAGSNVQFLWGMAKKQCDPLSLETRMGGGIQYRLFDLDPEWIFKTLKLPN
jgi:predicted nuclease with TOPRIM domain